MKLSRDWSGEELIRRLRKLGYEPTHQTGSHVRLTRRTQGAEHYITVPRLDPLRVGTLNNILNDVAEHLGTSRDEVLQRLF